MIIFFLFVLGAIVGSFLNVVALRWNTGLGIGGRSFCPHCGKTLRWYELVPIVSFLVLGARCMRCKSSISPAYLLVEVWTGLVFASVYAVSASLMVYAMYVLIFSLCIVITVYDARHKIIPDPLVYAVIMLSFAQALLLGRTWVDILAGPIIFSFFALIWLGSKGRAMGFGDAKLGLALGLLLGLSEGLSAIALAFWIGTLAVLAYLIVRKAALSGRHKSLTMKTEVPFGPFLVIGAWISLILSVDIFHVSSLF